MEIKAANFHRQIIIEALVGVVCFSVPIKEVDQSLNNCNCLGKKSVNSSELSVSQGEDT